MDAPHLDRVARALASESPRRHLITLLASGLLAGLARTRGSDEAQAKHKKKKKKKKGRCTSLGNACVSVKECCNPPHAFETYSYFCDFTGLPGDTVRRCIGRGVYCNSQYQCHSLAECTTLGICL
jgi:hypothetical protein